jgi:hypothetical protein
MNTHLAIRIVVTLACLSWLCWMATTGTACSPDRSDEDVDEVICRDTARDIFGDDSDPKRCKSKVDFYFRCIEQRSEERRTTRESLEVDYLERLQDCNERAQEAYEGWASCVYAEEIGRETTAEMERSAELPAEASDTKRGDRNASDVQDVRGEGAAPGGR